jgi:DNA helicase-2/ATP-dependent DNA helicase PcrA
MTISPEELQSLSEEEQVFQNVRTSLESQISRAQVRLRAENERARSITSEIMHTRRVEDKALLASDEAVSHGLKDSKREELDTLTKQLDNPYFARIELEEEQPTGATMRIEYKLGFAANTDCRIIDWRRAPISKLYYEYKEGDEYCEEILGRERNGRVQLRNRIEITKGELDAVENRYGTFVWNPKEAVWKRKSGAASKARRDGDGALPEILALITAEQFRSITVDADTAVLIQGIAGSGKTTVALHRLAWLLHHDNSPLKPHEATVIVLSPSLRAYIENSLPAAGLRGVSVRTYHEWAQRTFRTLFKGKDFSARRPMEHCPLEVAEVKRSIAILTAIDTSIAKRSVSSEGVRFEDLQRMLIEVLSNAEALVCNDPRKRLTESAVKHALERTREDFEAGMLDWNDDALLLRVYQRLTGCVINEQGVAGTYGHVVVDEVQDLSPVELATLIGSVKELKDLTLVGDVSQNLDRAQAFPGWEALQRYWNFDPTRSRYVSLEVSYRSTLPIMRLADYIQKRSIAKSGRAGRTPIWFMCRGEAAGIECALKWLTKAGELYPTRIAAVICATPQEAKFAYEMLKPTFGPRVRLGDATSFSFEEGVLVTDVRQVKGLEFFSVLLWNPSARAYPADELGRNLLYVAVTRAEENLSIVTWNRPAPALPPFAASNLIRSMDLTIVDEDNDEKRRGAVA